MYAPVVASFMLSRTDSGSSEASTSFVYGVLPALTAALLSGLSGAISQRVLQVVSYI